MPYGERSAQDVPTVHHERLLPAPSGLDPDYSWHLPGLLYLLTGLDRSMFELYALHAGRSIDVRTYQSSDPIIEVPGLDLLRWAGVVQGLPRTEHEQFLEHLHSYAFRGPRVEWTVESVVLRVADPFRRTCWPMTTTLWCPRSAHAGVRAIKHGGLTLARPRITLNERRVHAQS